MANILDKPFQSVCGYITVLPGAFSAYRYQALVGTPLEAYFMAEGSKNREEPTNMSCMTCLNIASANKYLAEDRILCFEIFTKKNCDYILRYIKEAKATTDAPDNLGVFLNQRRRWLNGSMFAFFSSFFGMGKVFSSSHSILAKFCFILELFYLMLDTIFTLLGPMNYYAVFILSLLNIISNIGVPSAAVYALGFVYILLFVFGIVIFVGNNPRGSQFLYTYLSYAWTVIMILIVAALVYSSYLLFITTPSPIKVVLFVVAICATYGLYIVSSLLFRDTAHLVSSMIAYFLLMPTYINMMLPFAMSNVHDISWYF